MQPPRNAVVTAHESRTLAAVIDGQHRTIGTVEQERKVGKLQTTLMQYQDLK